MVKGLFASFLMLASLGMMPEAFAQNDGNELLRDCKLLVESVDNQGKGFDNNEWLKIARCSGRLEGMGSAIRSLRGVGEQSVVCLPDGRISVEQLARVVIKYMEENPEQLHVNGMELALIALIKAYPCEEQ